MIREDKTTFGAIRWDAWYKNNGSDEADTSYQVERSLSPREFHFRAPFYASIIDGRIKIEKFDQTVFDTEMEYALQAGIDYFAYVWYSHPGLRKARDFHLLSKYKNEVKMCPCLDSNAILKDYAHREILSLFKDACCMTVLNGRPLVYYFGTGHNKENVKSDIDFYKRECKKQGLPSPYFVVMGVGPDDAKNMGADGISRYSVSGNNGISFKQLTEAARDLWLRHSAEGEPLGIDNVLPLTAGWHPYPRYKNPVKWMHVEENNWAEYATSEEIFEHYTDAVNFLKDEKYFSTTKANTCILYAWNEHDEGGWICPTLAVDENGEQLYNEDGTKKIDFSRLEAVKKAIKNI